jgi:hypothetical protein
MRVGAGGIIMSRYAMQDGTVVDTDNATVHWHECNDWDGNNHIGRSSRSQWHDQTLYRSRKGRYYVEYTSREQGVMNRVEWISPERAAAWLLLNEEELPEDLARLVDQVSE